MSKIASEQINAAYYRALKFKSFSSYAGVSPSSRSFLFLAKITLPPYHMWYKDMTFYVRVPVLSVQMHEVDPSVSTASRFFTSTNFSESVFAVIARQIVIHPSIPSGTFATRIPMPNAIHEVIGIFITKRASKKKRPPSTTETAVMKYTNLLSSIRRGVRTSPSPWERSAIYPRVVRSPIKMTIPFPDPSLQSVPKKATFAVSK